VNQEKKTSILIFSTAYLPLIGGAEIAIKNITDRISEYDFLLITTRLRKDLKKRERVGNVDVIRVGTGFWPFFDKICSPFLGAFVARRLMKERNIKLFWCMMVTFTSGAPFLLKILRLNKKIPILLTLQEGDPESHLKYSNFALSGLSWILAMCFADYIQAISVYLKDFAIRMGAKVRIEVIPNGVDIGLIRPRAIKSEKKKKIITTSRLVEKNGIDTLIEAVSIVKNKIPDIQCWIIGGGEKEDELKKLTAEHKVTENIVFFGEVLPNEIYNYLTSADVFVRASRSEGLGNSFLEAMGANLPIIGTPVGGIPDFLKDGETGLFVRPDDPQDLAGKIILLLEDSDLYEKISKNGRDLVVDHYSWESVSRSMLRIFKILEEAQI